MSSYTEFYSQRGTDYVINNCFDSAGVFVEVGCMDGLRFSNTLFLEQRDWEGICIEPVPRYAEMSKENRSSEVLNIALSDEPGHMDLYVDERCALSRIGEVNEERLRKKYACFDGFEGVISVETKTFSQVVSESSFDVVDFVSIDTEGHDNQVLKGISPHAPKVIATESADWNLIEDLGYQTVASVGFNSIHAREDLASEVADKISSCDGDEITLRHTKHPLDDSGELHKGFRIECKMEI